jgi:hypothetical protein
MAIPKVIEDYIGDEIMKLYGTCSHYGNEVDDICFNALSLGYAAGLWVCRAAIKAYVNEEAADNVMTRNYNKIPHLQNMIEKTRDSDQDIVSQFVQLLQGNDCDI